MPRWGRDELARILCVANQKGGVGKTTTAINLADALAKADQRTLLVDLDPQCNATTGLGGTVAPRHPLILRRPCAEAVMETKETHLQIMPGSRNVGDLQALNQAQRDTMTHLRQYLRACGEAYDIVLLDCPPSLGPLTSTALAAADEILMPVQCEYFAMEGLTQMIQIVRQVMSQPGQQLEFAGILMTMYDHALELTAEVDSEVREFFGEIVFDTVIPRDVSVSEASSFGRSVIDHAPRARGARAYIELCMEVLER